MNLNPDEKNTIIHDNNNIASYLKLPLPAFEKSFLVPPKSCINIPFFTSYNVGIQNDAVVGTTKKTTQTSFQNFEKLH